MLSSNDYKIKGPDETNLYKLIIGDEVIRFCSEKEAIEYAEKGRKKSNLWLYLLTFCFIIGLLLATLV